MKKLKYEILSPDMIPIGINGGYETIKEAKKDFSQWKKRYEQQGYYSANNGRINLKDLENFCTLVKL